MVTRRDFLRTAGATVLGAGVVSNAAMGAVPEAVFQTSADASTVAAE